MCDFKIWPAMAMSKWEPERLPGVSLIGKKAQVPRSVEAWKTKIVAGSRSEYSLFRLRVCECGA